MISFKHKFIFIHIPRTGGTSIENALSTYSEDRVDGVTIRPNMELMRMAKEKNVSLDNYKHFTYDKYKQILGDDIKDFFIFSVIRHPYERIPSLYYYSKVKEVSLARFIGRIKNGVHIVPSVGMELNKKKTFLGNADNIFLLKYETLNEDWLELLNKIDLPYTSLQNLNVGRKISYDDLYKDHRLLTIMNEVFKDELKDVDKVIVEDTSIDYEEIVNMLSVIEEKLPNGEIKKINKNLSEIKKELIKPFKFKRDKKVGIFIKIINKIKRSWLW